MGWSDKLTIENLTNKKNLKWTIVYAVSLVLLIVGIIWLSTLDEKADGSGVAAQITVSMAGIATFVSAYMLASDIFEFN